MFDFRKIFDAEIKLQKLENLVIDNENFEQLCLEFNEIHSCIKILRQALLSYDDFIEFSDIENLINVLIKKSELAIQYSQKVEYYTNL